MAPWTTAMWGVIQLWALDPDETYGTHGTYVSDPISSVGLISPIGLQR